MMVQKTSNTQSKADKQNEDLRCIESSFFKNWLKNKNLHNEEQFVMNFRELIFKIVDTYFVTSTKAKEYLFILESRKVISIEGDGVYYNSEKVKEKVQDMEDINKICKR